MNEPDRPHYLQVLKELHLRLLPRTYAEIGVQFGTSLRLALPGTKCVGIDPGYDIQYRINPNTDLFRTTSDQFFDEHDLRRILGSSLDLAFIDGQHLFEFALRDFMNLEKYCSSESLILIHDCYPVDAESSSRVRSTRSWSGDVWKVILCLKRYRPDLHIETIDAAPTGLGLIRNLDPMSSILQGRYDEICAEFIDLTFEDIAERQKEELNLVEGVSAQEVHPPFREGNHRLISLRQALRLPTMAALTGLPRRHATRLASKLYRGIWQSQ